MVALQLFKLWWNMKFTKLLSTVWYLMGGHEPNYYDLLQCTCWSCYSASNGWDSDVDVMPRLSNHDPFIMNRFDCIANDSDNSEEEEKEEENLTNTKELTYLVTLGMLTNQKTGTRGITDGTSSNYSQMHSC
jgi:hypothetical protein